MRILIPFFFSLMVLLEPQVRIAISYPRGGEDLPVEASPVDLPQIFVNTAYTLPTSTGDIDFDEVPTGGPKTIVVNNGENFQTALDNARRNDIIELQANVTYTGPYELIDKAGDADDGWIYVIGSNYASLPAPRNRVNPNLGGTCDTLGALPCGITANIELTDMPRIVSGGGNPHWISTEHGADAYRFIGIFFEPDTGDNVGVGLRLYTDINGDDHATLAEMTSDIIFDRCVMRGLSASPWAGRAIAIQGNRHAVIESYILLWIDDDSDTQGILLNGYVSGALVRNNFIEATGENVYTDNVNTIDSTNYVPSDVRTYWNHIRKYVEYNSMSLNNTKNHIEAKAGVRILHEANLVITHYNQAQDAPINIKIGDEDTLKHGSDFTLRYMKVIGAANGMKTCAAQCNSANNTNIIDGMAIYGNLYDNIDAAIYGTGSDGNGQHHLVTGPNTYIEHNTHIGSGNGIASVFQRAAGVSDGEVLRIRNNIFRRATDFPLASEVTTISSAGVLEENLIVAGPSCASNYGATNQCPADYAAVGFVNFNSGSGGDYTLDDSSDYKGDGDDPLDVGTNDPGANIFKLNNYTSCAFNGQCANWRVLSPPAPLTILDKLIAKLNLKRK